MLGRWHATQNFSPQSSNVGKEVCEPNCAAFPDDGFLKDIFWKQSTAWIILPYAPCSRRTFKNLKILILYFLIPDPSFFLPWYPPLLFLWSSTPPLSPSFPCRHWCVLCCMSEMASPEWGKMAPRMKEAVCIHTTTKSETEGQKSQKTWIVIELLFQPHRYGTPTYWGRNFWQSSERKHWGLCLEIELGPLPPMSPFLFSSFLLTAERKPWIMTRGD